VAEDAHCRLVFEVFSDEFFAEYLFHGPFKYIPQIIQRLDRESRRVGDARAVLKLDKSVGVGVLRQD